MNENTLNKPQVSIIMPCLNEEEAIGICLGQVEAVIKKSNLDAEIIVVDNGSGDNSCNVARERKAKLIYEPQAGYGAACLKGFNSARGEFLFLADCDGTYDFEEIPRFIAELENGYDFVIGNRFGGIMEKGSMPWMHRYIGNPFLSALFRLFFNAGINDVHCGMRALTKQSLAKLNLQTSGMEFASEMLIKAVKLKMKIKELDINYRKRYGESKLNSLVDGWRHLRFMLLYSPLFLFFLPGLLSFLSGIFLMGWMFFTSPKVFGLRLYVYPMFLAALLIIIGYQLILFAIFAKTYAVMFLKDKPIFDRAYKYITIERACIAGIFFSLVGATIYLKICIDWVSAGFSNINQTKNSILALTFIIFGMQTFFFSFMLSILGIKEK